MSCVVAKHTMWTSDYITYFRSHLPVMWFMFALSDWFRIHYVTISAALVLRYLTLLDTTATDRLMIKSKQWMSCIDSVLTWQQVITHRQIMSTTWWNKYDRCNMSGRHNMMASPLEEPTSRSQDQTTLIDFTPVITPVQRPRELFRVEFPFKNRLIWVSSHDHHQYGTESWGSESIQSLLQQNAPKLWSPILGVIIWPNITF